MSTGFTVSIWKWIIVFFSLFLTNSLRDVASSIPFPDFFFSFFFLPGILFTSNRNLRLSCLHIYSLSHRVKSHFHVDFSEDTQNQGKITHKFSSAPVGLRKAIASIYRVPLIHIRIVRIWMALVCVQKHLTLGEICF